METYRFYIASENHKEKLVEYLLQHFKDEEPITRSLNLSSDDAKSFFIDLVNEGIEKPVSFVVLNEDDEIIGCRLNSVVAADEKGFEGDVSSYSTGPKRIVQLLDALLENVDKILPKYEKIMKFVTVSVHPMYQRRGIARKLIEMSIEKAVAEKCDYIMVTATAIRSQTMFAKMGFQAIKEISYADFVDENDDQIFCCDDGTASGQLMIKKVA